MEKPQFFTESSELPPNTKTFDAFEDCLKELFYIENPTVDKRAPETGSILTEYVEKKKTEIEAVWIYYQHKNAAVRVPEEKIFYQLRTARNRNVIYPEEQMAYRNMRIGIAGLSVGSAALSAIVQTGGPKHIKIADPDAIELTNLNRMRATLTDLGKNKTDIAALNAWDLDPFAELDLWDAGLTKESLKKFLTENGNLDVFIDEMDNINLKIASRIACRELGIPVIMATDNGDSVILDVERYDLEPERSLFHGQVSEEEYDFNPKSSKEFIKMANKIIDPDFFTERQLASIQQIGKSLSGVAQLATAVLIAGATVAYAVRLLATPGRSLPSGRYIVGCDFLTKKSG